MCPAAFRLPDGDSKDERRPGQGQAHDGPKTSGNRSADVQTGPFRRWERRADGHGKIIRHVDVIPPLTVNKSLFMAANSALDACSPVMAHPRFVNESTLFGFVCFCRLRGLCG
jgi:hypothetical protein